MATIKSIILFLTGLLIMMIMPIVVLADYSQLGTQQGNYLTGTGLFNELLTPSITGSITLSNPQYVPLVDDLDGDGDEEIIILDGTSLRILQDSTLTSLTSRTIGNISSLNHIIIFDIDGDGNNEIIIASNSSFIQTFEFNGTALNKEMQMELDDFPDPANFIGNGEVVIQCMDTNLCIAVYPEDTRGLATNSLLAMGFDSFGNNGSAITLKDGSGVGASIFCNARQKSIAINARSGADQFVVANARWSTTNGEELFIYGINIQANLTVSENFDFNIPDYDMIAGNPTITGSTCEVLAANTQLPQNSFTSPLSADIGDGGEEEIIMGYMIDSNEFNMRVIRSDASPVRTYPTIFDADGTIVSNVITADVFGLDDTGTSEDFCVLGYADNVNELDLLCISEQSNNLPFGVFSEEFKFDFDAVANQGLDNMTTSYNTYQSTVHAGFHKGGDAKTEIISSYGVFESDYIGSVLAGAFDSSLIMINRFAQQNTTVIPTDAEGVGLSDMLQLANSNLFYLDDGFINAAGQITEITINPCIDAVWKQNTTVNIRIKVEDVNQDLVRSAATLYFGDSNQQISNETNFFASGTTFSHSFIANTTISNGQIRMYGQDTENNDTVEVLSRTFNVAANGVELNDCITTQLFLLDESTVQEPTIDPNVVQDLDNNALTVALDVFTDESGLGRTISWLIVMAVITFGIFIAGRTTMATVAGAAMFNGFMVIIGTFLGFFSLGIILSITVITLAVVVIFAWRKIVSGEA